jgi:hypothetical protein
MQSARTPIGSAWDGKRFFAERGKDVLFVSVIAGRAHTEQVPYGGATAQCDVASAREPGLLRALGVNDATSAGERVASNGTPDKDEPATSPEAQARKKR